MKGEAVRNIVIPRGPLKCGKYYSMEDEKKKEMKAEEASKNNETTRLWHDGASRNGIALSFLLHRGLDQSKEALYLFKIDIKHNFLVFYSISYFILGLKQIF